MSGLRVRDVLVHEVYDGRWRKREREEDGGHGKIKSEVDAMEF